MSGQQTATQRRQSQSRSDKEETLRKWGLRDVAAVTPGGVEVRLRPMNLKTFALAGGLPRNLRDLATRGAPAVNEAIAAAHEDGEAAKEVREFLDRIIRAQVIEPTLEGFENLDEAMLPVDYEWNLRVAFLETDEDGLGRRLWGREPISRWATFRAEHGCAEDCEACRRVFATLSGVLG